MDLKITMKSHRMLAMNALAFMVCFAVWVFNGVMVTFLVDNNIFAFSPVQTGWLLGVPILTGALLRLPLGILTDKFGGKWIFVILLILCAIPMFLYSYAGSFWEFLWCGFGFGLSGASFAVGVANTSVWYPKEWQGTALGIFGVGNIGAAVTTLFAPTILNSLTAGNDIDNWRILPKIYAAALLVMAVIFIFLTENKKPDTKNKTFKMLLQPLANIQVWRFGLYYFLVFGCFVAVSQWLVQYFVNVYAASLVTAGILASVFSLPAGLTRALGGWFADKWGARQVMIRVFVVCIVMSVLLSIPRMEIFSPGKAVTASRKGTVSFVSEKVIKVDDKQYNLSVRNSAHDYTDETSVMVLPTRDSWQIPVVKEGDHVVKKQMLAKGVTRIYFQANMWIFTILVLMIGIAFGIGMGGVYRFIPDYFPKEVGVVGGMVGVIGGLGGFFCPIIFGYLLEGTGLWTSCWIFILLLSIACFWWLRNVVARMMRKAAPEFITHLDEKQ